MIYLSELPTAQQARELVEHGLIDKANKELAYINELIHLAIGENRTSITYSKGLMESTVGILRGLGYNVKGGSQYNESYCNISW